MVTVDINTTGVSPSHLGSPPRIKKRPRSLLAAMSAPGGAGQMIDVLKAAAGRSSTVAHGGERKVAQEQKQQLQPLLPGLPDHLAHLCLSRLPPLLLYSVSRSWRRLLYSSPTPPFPAIYALLSNPSSFGPFALEFQSFDPISSKWVPLPSPHPHPPFLLRHPAFLSRHFPVQSVVVGDSLVLLAATAYDAAAASSGSGQGGRLVPALHRPLVFHAPTGTWRHGPPFRPAARRWCAAGAMQGKVYVASGITGPDYDAAAARAMHRWDVSFSSSPAAAADQAAGASSHSSSWEELTPLKDGRFSREPVDAVAARGKLYMVNVRGGWAREGLAYDPSTDRWQDMPPGMLMGWTGPAAVLSFSEVEDGNNKRNRDARDRYGDETIYCVEAADGVLWAYDWGRDKWAAVLASEKLKGALQLTAAGTTKKKNKLCAVLAGGAGVAVIDVTARRMWEVQPPEGRLVVGVHVLPRMSRADEEDAIAAEDDDEEARRRIAAAHLSSQSPRFD